jgi:hypothetical protein
MFRAYDMVRLKHLFRGSTPKSLSPITDEDIEAYKYTFAKRGKYFCLQMSIDVFTRWVLAEFKLTVHVRPAQAVCIASECDIPGEETETDTKILLVR